MSRDHIPAENLFLPPRTGDLITVPCCDQCNEGTSKDDEYLRLALAFRTDALAHPSMAALRPKILRALEKVQKWRFAAYFQGRTFARILYSPLGLFIPGVLHSPDPKPLRRVAERIARGLYFHHLGRRVPAGQRAWVLAEVNFGLEGTDFILEKIRAHPAITIGRGEFAYQYHLVDSPTAGESSGWLLTFYQAVPFLVLFLAPGQALQGPQ